MKQIIVSSSSMSFTDDHMFCTVVKDNPKIAAGIVERVTGHKVHKIVGKIVDQKSVKPGMDIRGVRFDVIFEDDTTVYNIEMQATNNDDMPKRARLYTDAVDISHSCEGMRFRELKNTIVIFIELFDQFGFGEYVYPVSRHIDTHLEYPYDDGSKIFFVNANGTHGNAPEGLRTLLSYVRTGQTGDEMTRSIAAAVSRFSKDPEWRDAHMRFEYKLALEREEGKEEGKKEGKKEGVNEESSRMQKLLDCLDNAGRHEEICDAIRDPKKKQELYKEFGLL